MNWTNLIKSDIEETYRATEKLVKMVDASALGWRPQTGSNWMTTAQLLEHITSACGMCVQGFVTGKWPPPPPDGGGMLPPAEKMTSARSVDETLKKLAADKKLALDMLAQAGESELANRQVSAPWDPTPKPLGKLCLEMVGHLANHKAQLFYYLKLQGKPVNTMNFYGMG